MNWKVGDKVLVKPDLRAHESTTGLNIVDEMEKYAGKIVTILSAQSVNYGNGTFTLYKIHEDRQELYWSWDDTCFLPASFSSPDDVYQYAIQHRISDEKIPTLLKEVKNT